MFEWHNMNINTIIGGVAPDGVLFLKYFLIDYKKEFHVENVNPSCQTCLQEYHNKFIKKYIVMNANCSYRLRKKREGITIPFSDGKTVNNATLTNEIALKLLTKWDNAYLFDIYPKGEVIVEEEKQITTGETTESKPIYINKKKKRK